METYAAIRLAIDNWRWAGVPIYIRTGKAMAVTSTEVLVEFRLPPRDTFGESYDPVAAMCASASAPTWSSPWV